MSDPRRTPTVERPTSSTNRSSHSTGARAVGSGDRRRKRGLWPILLGLLALLAIGALLAALLSGGDDDEQAGSGSAQQQQQQPSAGAGAGGAASGGELTAGGSAVIPSAAASIGERVGERAEGRQVVVQSVVQSAEDPNALEGFWVGSSAQDRVYVEWGGDVGANEADFQPKEGDRVNLAGPVKAAPQEAERVLNLSPEDAALVSRQGAYVNADEVTPAG